VISPPSQNPTLFWLLCALNSFFTQYFILKEHRVTFSSDPAFQCPKSVSPHWQIVRRWRRPAHPKRPRPGRRWRRRSCWTLTFGVWSSKRYHIFVYVVWSMIISWWFLLASRDGNWRWWIFGKTWAMATTSPPPVERFQSSHYSNPLQSIRPLGRGHHIQASPRYQPRSSTSQSTEQSIFQQLPYMLPGRWLILGQHESIHQVYATCEYGRLWGSDGSRSIDSALQSTQFLAVSFTLRYPVWLYIDLRRWGITDDSSKDSTPFYLNAFLQNQCRAHFLADESFLSVSGEETWSYNPHQKASKISRCNSKEDTNCVAGLFFQRG